MADMLAAFDVLLAQPLVLLAILACGAGMGIVVEKFFAGVERDRRRAYWAGRKRSGDKVSRVRIVPNRKYASGTTDAPDQLRIVENAAFAARPLLNRPEAKLFEALDRLVVARNSGWQVMAQVSLGEFLRSEDAAAFACINSKRVDFALMDSACRIRNVIEYQGHGHHLPGGSAAARDAVKKEACRQAGIGWHEVLAGHTTPAELRALVDKLVPPPPRREPEMEQRSRDRNSANP